MAVVKRVGAFVQGLVGFVAGRWTVFYAHILYKLVGLEAVMQYVKCLRQPVRGLRSFGVQLGEGTIIYPGIIIHAAVGDFSNLKIGENCCIGRDCFFDLTEPIKIADMASMGVQRHTLR
jgi:hypothetical protein